jgi:hypothetical protein
VNSAAVEGDGLQAVRYHPKTVAALAAEGRSLSWERIPTGAKARRVARVMYELKLVPFIPPGSANSRRKHQALPNVL